MVSSLDRVFQNPEDSDWNALRLMTRLTCGSWDSHSARCPLEKLLSIEEFPWALALYWAKKHGIAASLLWHIGKMKESTVPKGILTSLEGYADGRRKRCQLLKDCLVDLLWRFARKGIKAIPIKGPVIAEYYPDPLLREYLDIDLYIRLEDFNASKEIMTEAGFIPERPYLSEEQERRYLRGGYVYHFVKSKGDRQHSVAVEIHWNLGAKSFGYRPSDALWKRTREKEIEGVPYAALSREDMFIFVAVHGCRHVFGRFKWLMDVAQLTRSAAFNRDRAIAIAAEQKAREMARASIQLADSFLPRELLPKENEDQTQRQRSCRKQGRIEELVDRALFSQSTLIAEIEVNLAREFHILTKDCLMDRLRYSIQVCSSPSKQDRANSAIRTSKWQNSWLVARLLRLKRIVSSKGLRVAIIKMSALLVTSCWRGRNVTSRALEQRHDHRSNTA